MEQGNTEVLLREQNRILKRQLSAMRVCCVACAAVLAAVLVSAAVVVPKVNSAAGRLAAVADTVEELDLKTLSESLSGFAQAGEASMDEVADALEAFDVEAFNAAVADLKTVIGPLAELLG